MYRMVSNSKLPRVLKVLIYALLTITCVYWLGMMIYKILETIRIFINWTSTRRNWWTFLMCILIVVVGGIIVAQFFLGLNPIGNFLEQMKNWWQEIKADFVEAIL